MHDHRIPDPVPLVEAKAALILLLDIPQAAKTDIARLATERPRRCVTLDR
jgi:hypothetical protein